MNKELRVIQLEVAVWNEFNFPNNTKENCILGIVEEIGELSHCILKQNQGIRKESSTEEKLQDAIGDIVIYALNYCNYCGIDIMEALDSMHSDDHENISILDCITDMCFQIDSLTRDSSIIGEVTIGGIIRNLYMLCEHKDYCLLDITNTVWDEVSQRNWHEFPNNGKTY